MKKKVHIVAPNESWILDRFKQEFSSYLINNPDFDLVEELNPYNSDILWFVSGYSIDSYPLELLQKKKVVCMLHHIVPKKFDINVFLDRDKFVDCYIIPTKHTIKKIKKFTSKPIIKIKYWLMRELWSPIPKQLSRKNLALPENKFIIGSFQRDTEGHDLKSPKLEKGPDVFVEAVKAVDNSNKLVLLNGYRRQYIERRLKEENIDFINKGLQPTMIVRDMYAACDLYIVGSRYEGGPQAILECASMKVPIISTDVGVASEILHRDDIRELPVGMLSGLPTQKTVEHAYKNVLRYDIKYVIVEYVEAMLNA